MTRIGVLLLGLAACEPGPELRPAECDAEKMAPWILDCVEKANPKSDEEPEDSTRQCEQTAIHMYCGPNCFATIGGQILCGVHP